MQFPARRKRRKVGVRPQACLLKAFRVQPHVKPALARFQGSWKSGRHGARAVFGFWPRACVSFSPFPSRTRARGVPTTTPLVLHSRLPREEPQCLYTAGLRFTASMKQMRSLLLPVVFGTLGQAYKVHSSHEPPAEVPLYRELAAAIPFLSILVAQWNPLPFLFWGGRGGFLGALYKIANPKKRGCPCQNMVAGLPRHQHDQHDRPDQ